MSAINKQVGDSDGVRVVSGLFILIRQQHIVPVEGDGGELIVRVTILE